MLIRDTNTIHRAPVFHEVSGVRIVRWWFHSAIKHSVRSLTIQGRYLVPEWIIECLLSDVEDVALEFVDSAVGQGSSASEFFSLVCQ